MNTYRYEAVPRFWRSYRRLSASQQQSVKAVWRIFRVDPFDTRLRTHRIHHLSAVYGRTVYAVEVERDLRVVFCIREDTVISLDVGSHSLYQA